MSRRTLSEVRHALARHVHARRGIHERRRAGVEPLPAEASGRRVELLDSVELVEPFDQWPSGTLAAVADIKGDRALVEVSSEHGYSLDLFQVSLASLRVAEDLAAVDQR